MAQTATLPHADDPAKPRILFVHQNYPGQFRGIGLYLRDRGWDVLFATAHEHARDGKITVNSDGLRVFGYRARREPSETVSRYLRPMEKAVINGQAFAGGAVKLRRHGYVPDIICAHSGWGSASFAKVIWPDVRFVQYLEWWYGYPPRDRDPRAELKNAEDKWAATLCRNLPFLLDAQTADAILVPTAYQAMDIPEFLLPKLTVLHDGADCDFFSPGKPGQRTWLRDLVGDDTPLVTYATRGMEPMRGFPEFMAAWARVQNTHPRAHCVIAGNDSVHYEGDLSEGDSWKKRALAAHEFDMERLHFTGLLPRARYRELLRRTDCHAYLTRPFVLSWSLIDAMACAAPLVVSDVEPVREALPRRDMAKAVDHHDISALARAIMWMLDNPEAACRMGRRAAGHARATYACSILHPKKADYFQSLID
ncbi:MAG: glycosyltransferase [Pseudomonadota bacterium]